MTYQDIRDSGASRIITPLQLYFKTHDPLEMIKKF